MIHGVNSRLYRIWRCMKMRCLKPSHEAYVRYGGSGIEICREWLNSFMEFRSWSLDNGYSDDLTIDRICNKDGYHPGNCRWATYLEQERNKESLLPAVTAFGETKKICEWADAPRCVIPYKSLRRRIIDLGRDPEWAMTTPANHGRRRKPHSEETKRKLRDKALERGISNRGPDGRIVAVTD